MFFVCEMQNQMERFRHIFTLNYILCYGKGKNVVQTRKKLYEVYEEGILTVRNSVESNFQNF